MSGFANLLLLALAPVIAIVLYVYARDKYDHEPFKKLFLAFVFGILATFIAIIPESIFRVDYAKASSSEVFVFAFFVVGLSEEFAKFYFIRFILFKSKYFNEPFDGIMYSVMVSMGFAAFENVFYVLDGGAQVGYIRMLTAVPAHAAYAVLMGFYIGKEKFQKTSFPWSLLGLFVAVIAHGAYDFFLMQNESDVLKLLSMIVLALVVYLSFKAMKIRLNDSFRYLQQFEQDSNDDEKII